LKTTLRTDEPGPPQAARTFMVPITLFSWARRGVVMIASATRPGVDDGVDLRGLDDPADERVVVLHPDELRALQRDLRRPLSTPMIASTEGSRSSDWARRPPQ
jgi:hypothetical protein